MGQMNSQDAGDAYTIVVFRGSTAKPLRFSFSRKLVRNVVIGGCLLLLADFLVISHYVIRTQEVWELTAFRTEAMSAREQTAAFSSAVDDLKKRLVSMKEVNQRLRVMLGIEVPKPGDMVNGRGGEDVPLPEATEMSSRSSNKATDATSGNAVQGVEGNQEHSSLAGQDSSRN
ncbi:MAG: hypothetical protein HP494_03350, partial [Nitrospira sp.]|nr:hypothetical protein [Nitrospira sp.]